MAWPITNPIPLLLAFTLREEKRTDDPLIDQPIDSSFSSHSSLLLMNMSWVKADA